MTKAEAVNYIITKSGEFIAGRINEVELYDIIESYVKMVEMTAKAIEPVKCPDCGGEMISRKGAYGVFWGCKKYPNCRGTRDSEGKSKLDREIEKAENQPVEPIDERYRFKRG